MDCQGKAKNDNYCICRPWTRATGRKHSVEKSICAECKGDSNYLKQMMAETGQPPCRDDQSLTSDVLSAARLLNETAKKFCVKCSYQDDCLVYGTVPCKVGLPGYDCPQGKLFQPSGKHPALGKTVFVNRYGDPLNIIGMYQGQSCFLVCNGPSITNYEKHLLNQPGIISMGINNGAAYADFRPNLWTAQDPPYKFMRGIWDDPKILKFTMWGYRNCKLFDPQTRQFMTRKLKDLPNLIFHRRHSSFQAQKWFAESKIVWGRPKDSGGNRSTMLAALHILWFLGFVNVYLLGADFYMDADTKYFFDEDRSKASIRNNNRLFRNLSRYFTELQPYMLQQGFRVWNCNSRSNLKVFPFQALEAAVRQSVINTSVSTKGMYVKR